MTHDYHPQVWCPEAGVTDGPILADGCARCEEISDAPAANLDQRRQAELLRRTKSGERHQSILDRRAVGMLVEP